MSGMASESIQIQTVNPEQAREFLKCNFIHNRPPRKAWVSFLAREMAEGRFIQTAEIHIMYRNGEPVMVNGQHTCLAIQQYGKPVRVTVRKSRVTESGQISMVYAFGHDTQLRRTWTDQMGAYDLTEQTGLDRQSLEKLSGALRYIKNSFGSGHTWARPGHNASKDLREVATPAELLGIVVDWAPEMKLFNLAVQPCEKKMLNKLRGRASLAVGLITFRFQPDIALEFWRSVARPDRLEWNDPRATARNYIDNFESRAANSAQKLSRQVARLWSAYMVGGKLEQARVADPLCAITIAGTPYNGRQKPGFLPEAATDRE